MPHMFLRYRVRTMFYFEANSTFILCRMSACTYERLFLLGTLISAIIFEPGCPKSVWLSDYFVWTRRLFGGCRFPVFILIQYYKNQVYIRPSYISGLSLSCLSMQGRSCRILKQVGRLSALFLTKNKAKSKV